MNMSHTPSIGSFVQSRSSILLRSLIVVAGASAAVNAADNIVAENDLRLVPQLIVGTAGLEPGLALEWRGSEMEDLIIRPEVLISEDGNIGGGGAVLFDLSEDLELPNRQAVAIGPRIVYHHADDHGWEADVMATWAYELSSVTRPWRHSIGALVAVGVIQDRKHDDADLAANIGGFYAFRF